MRRALGWLRWLLGASAVLVLLAAATAAGLVWLTLPGQQLHATIQGLSAPAEIKFDADGIPWISAQTADDAAAALGFVHARDRMFQMDLMRRAASGRLSEIIGPATLQYDRTMRVLGLRQAAIADYAALPPETRSMLDAYARGVNAWITAQGRFAAVEFLLLGPPEPWTSVDCLLWAKTMGLSLSNNYRTELARLALAAKLPEEKINQLWPADSEAGHPDASITTPAAIQTASMLGKILPRFPQPFTLPATASNEWAVGGAHTQTGAPLLAGDPHLGYSQPGIWYVAHIETPSGVLVGATAPGVPFLVLGHNGHIAWSFTSTGADVQDVFVETQTDANHYLGPEGPLPYELREERIAVRGQPDVLLTVRRTRHGPVISDLTPASGQVIAVSMANLMPGDIAAAGLLALNRATDVAAAGRAAQQITSPVQNLLVADRTDIALFLTGRVPIRRSGDGAAPVEGADGKHDWLGFADGEALPHLVDPPSGRLVNANERVAPPDFPVFLGRDWFGEWRSGRIRAMLEKSDRHTVADFAAMQTDVHSLFAERLLPRLKSVKPTAPLAINAAALVAAWDGEMKIDRPEPLIFNAWIREFRRMVLAAAGIGENAAVADLEFSAFLLTPEGAPWCGGDCTKTLADALEKSTAALAALYGNDPTIWRWGIAHEAIFANPVLSRLPLLGTLTTGHIAAPGDESTVDRGGLDGADFNSDHGASFRGVYDLADLDRSRFVVTPGQSGNPASSHARDFITRWRNGDTIILGPFPSTTAATVSLETAP